MDDENKAWNAAPPPRAAKAQSDDPADRPLAVGDVVVLKSGGHAMTIESFAPPAPAPGGLTPAKRGFDVPPDMMMAHCVWQSRDGHFLDRALWPHTIVRTGDDRLADRKPEQINKTK